MLFRSFCRALVPIVAALALVGRAHAQLETVNPTVADPASIACNGPRTAGELREQFLTGYDKFTRPNAAEALANGWLPGEITSPPEDARVQMHVLSLIGVDQKRNEYALSAWLRRSWKDKRLAFQTVSQGGCFPDGESIGFKSSLLSDIWSPDFYIDNLANKAIETAAAVWIDSDGRVLWSSQVDMTLACKMEFPDMPFDIQKCGLRVGTYLENAKQIVLDFMDGIDPVTMASENIGTSGSLPQGGTPEWTILFPPTTRKIQVSGALQPESAVEIQFEFQRKSSYYTSFVMIPCFMFVTIGWASFFVNRSAAPARVAMSMICFLANTNFLVAQLGQLPRLGNDVWLLKFLTMCTWFSFYSVVEYVVCNYLRRVQARLDGVTKKLSEQAAQDVELNISSKREEPASAKADEPENGRKSPRPKGTYKGFTKDDIMATGFNRKLDLLLLSSKTGSMFIKDEHVDIFSRYMYPVAYVACFLGLWYTK